MTIWTASDLFEGEDSPGMASVRQVNQRFLGQIEVQVRYFHWDEYDIAIREAVSSLSLPDIFVAPKGHHFQSFLPQSLLYPVNEIVSERWISQFDDSEFAVRFNIVDGKLYAWPGIGPELGVVLYVNKTVLQEAGMDSERVPGTWEELVQISETIRQGSDGTKYGLLIGGGEPGQVRQMLQGIVAGIEPAVASGFDYRSGAYAFEGAAWKQALRIVAELSERSVLHPSSYTISEDEARSLFMMNHSAFLLADARMAWKLELEGGAATTGIGPMPTSDGSKPVFAYSPAYSTNDYMVSAMTRHPQQVGLVIEELFSQELYYESLLRHGAALTPFQALNDRTELYPSDMFTELAEFHNHLLRRRPEPAIVNAELVQLFKHISSLDEPSFIQPGIAHVLQKLFNRTENDVDFTLRSLNEKLNEQLGVYVTRLRNQGEDISMEDLRFPYWNPHEDYADAEYENRRKGIKNH
ncbi:ABC transporter substrate-binding protein [Paenibacillus chungangensis]|uniref:ABC transporter substrate-binding protein n=1 Tax=Paenibacillus chungangensis TaxID=696535 RepID=A0ABW3HQE1_9BACL